MTFPYRLGWLRDLPDIRDYTKEHTSVYPILDRLVRLPLQANGTPILPSEIDLRWHCSPVENQLALGSCFPPGTRIRMADGSERNIEEVHCLDRIVTAEGNIGTVISTMVRYEDQGLLNLIMWGHRHLRLTQEHPILTMRGYVMARDLIPGDWISFPIYQANRSTCLYIKDIILPEMPQTTISKRRFSSPRNRGSGYISTTPIPEKISLDYHMGRIFGLFLAEGNISYGKVVWSFHINERDTLAHELYTLLQERFNAVPRIRLMPEHHGCKVTIYGKHYCTLFSILCGNGSGGKNIHPILLSSNIDFMRGLFSGWSDGDGYTCRHGNRKGVSTISRQLALAMFDISQSMGLQPSLLCKKPIMNQYAKTRQEIWELSHVTIKDNYRHQRGNNCIWRKLREVRHFPFGGFVFNLTVDTDNSYIAEGVGVHNCTANAGVGLMEYFQKRTKGHYLDGSRLFLYKTTRNLMGVMGDTGAYLRNVMGAITLFGIPPERYYPYDVAKFDEEPRAFDYALAQNFQALRYYRVDPPGTSTATLLVSIKESLANGLPCIFGFTVYDNLGDGPLIPMPLSTSRVVGGHAVVAVGYDPNGIIIRNSWGTAWGDAGYGTLPNDYILSGLTADWWTMVDAEWVDLGVFD